MTERNTTVRGLFGCLVVGGMLLGAGCTSTVTGPHSRPDAGPRFDLAGADLSGDMAIYMPPDIAMPAPDIACFPTVTSCTGLCGPVPDTCLGTNVQCGACTMAGTVCDLKTNTCVPANTDCASLAAQRSPPPAAGLCGVTKNACGARLDCGDCAASGSQCDPNTNLCVTCDKTVMCSDLGYQCGYAWLGCGDRNDSANYTYCGDCAGNELCNPINNLCEPKCNPDPLTVCLAANKALGYNCGIISNGCGGTVDCSKLTAQDSRFGCQKGYACGAQGDQNICEPFEVDLQCLIAGYTCGTIVSACGGQAIPCGVCTGTDVCRANHTCGPPCAPAACPSAYQCGFIDDGCGNTMESCGNCGKLGDVCLANHNCCTPETVGQYQNNNQCGNQLIDPVCGSPLNVPCVNGGTCSTCTDLACANSSTPGVAGTCCLNTAKCPTDGSCNNYVTDSCTGVRMACPGCAANTYCTTSGGQPPGTCQAKKNCTSYGANKMAGDICSYGNAFDDGTGTNTFINPPCDCGPTNFCIQGTPNPGVNPTVPMPIVSGNSTGECCVPAANACVITAGSCNGNITNSCTGTKTACNCSNLAGNQICVANTCVPMDTMCSSFTPPANGVLGAPCSNGNASFPGGDGTADATCKCNGGLECISGSPGSGTIVSGSTKGDCCDPTAGGAFPACPKNPTAGSECTSHDACTGRDNPVGNCCGGGLVCDVGTQKCIAKDVCGTDNSGGGGLNLSGDKGAQGNPCGNYTDPVTGQTGGASIYCGCSTGGGFGNAMCSVAKGVNGAGGTGTCVCAAKGACTNCNDNAKSNGCGGTLSCACAAAPVECRPGQPNDIGSIGCCLPYTCATVPLAPPPTGGETVCGSFANGCGDPMMISCGDCTFGGTKTGGACVQKIGANYGTCQCTPQTCAQNPNATTDGCGNALHCDACGRNNSPPGLDLSNDTGADGKSCGTYSDPATGQTGGASVTCGCSKAGNRNNETCVGGVCSCTASVCASCNSSGTDNCGGSLSCGCPGGQVCAPGKPGDVGNLGCCVALTSCASFSNSLSSDPAHPICGTYSDNCNLTVTCADCTKLTVNGGTGMTTNGVCTPTSGSQYKNCQCTPFKCGGQGCHSDGTPCGTGDPNGCGRLLTCGG